MQFNCASDSWLDVRALQEILNDTNQAIPNTKLENAISLYRGDFLEGFFVRDSVAYEDWMLLIRDRLQRQVVTVLQHLVENHTDQRDYEHACAYAWRWVQLEPWQEDRSTSISCSCWL